VESQTVGGGVTAPALERGNPLYLYCLFKGPPSLSPQKGIDGVNATFTLSRKDLCQSGSRASAFQICALVSEVPASEYNEQTLNCRLEDLQWLIPRASCHEGIVRYAAAFHPVIPVRFGTIYTSRESVREMLSRGLNEFGAFLDYISDKQEWGIKVYTDEDTARKAVETTDELLEQLDKQIAAASPGKAHLLQKKRASLIRQQSLSLLNHLSESIYQELLLWAVEGRRNKLLSKSATGKADEMLLNAVFLLNTQEVKTFKEKVDAIATSHERDALSFELSGPWPCYNFCPEFQI
jgi:hypothetical protein